MQNYRKGLAKMASKIKYAKIQEYLKKVLRYIRDESIPNKVGTPFLKKRGVTPDNISNIRSVIQAMGLIDKDHKPTETWAKARKDFEKTMLECLKNLYPDDDNFLKYKDDSNEDLEQYFKAEGDKLGKGARDMARRTFLTIQDAANGKLGEQKGKKSPRKSTKQNKPPKKRDETPIFNQGENKTEVSSPQAQQQPQGPRETQVVINIQLTVPEDPSGKVYEKFFAAMKKYLYPNNE